MAVFNIAAEAGRVLEAERQSLGREVMLLETDVTRSEAVRDSLARVNAAWGSVDTLFSHASTIIVKPLHTSADEDYDRLMAINVRSAFIVCREVVAQMRENGGGSIVITSSIGGEKGFALESIYCMTKGAVLQLARSIAAQADAGGLDLDAGAYLDPEHHPFDLWLYSRKSHCR